MNAPCYNCVDRKATCHDICEKYREFKGRMDDIKRSKKEFNYGRSVIIESCLRQTLVR
jgi:hypothetical protein